MLSDLFDVFSEDIAIDLGTANTLVYVPRRGIVIDEPSVVAIQSKNGSRQVIAFGKRAKDMLGRTPDNIETIRPLRDGVIADFLAAEEMIRHYILTAKKNMGFRRPRVLISVPASATSVERRAVYETAISSGARQAFLVEEPVVAAIGAGLPVDEPRGSMVVDIGGGTTDIAVLSLGGILDTRAIRCGGDAMDGAIIKYIRKKHSLLIGEANAERVKQQVGTAFSGEVPVNGHPVELHIRGRELSGGRQKEIILGSEDIAEALAEPLQLMAETIQFTIEDLPPDLASDICEDGIVLTGGGALLRDIDKELLRLSGFKFHLADEPLHSVIIGTGRVLADLDEYRDILIAPQ